MVHNFSAGPCILPQEVFKEASEAILNFNNLGLSLIEISHRSAAFVDVMEEARALVKELLNVPNGYTVLFLQGGASLGFLKAAYNMAGTHKKSAYINTGTWSTKAIKEARFTGEVDVIASSEDKGFNYIPKGYTVPQDVDYLHFTTNNTIYGTQFKALPEVGNVPLVADMSSDIFSKEIDASAFDLIYAGAQKNMGPAGTTVFIVKDEVFGRSPLQIPTMLNLETHAKKDSMFNTPPVFAVYVSMLNLRWLKKNGGVKAIEAVNNKKAETIYNEIDRNDKFVGFAAKEDRSNMNATFNLVDDSLKERFDQLLKEANINGLKGHRSVGGYRASMYNALPLSSVEAVVEVMRAL